MDAITCATRKMGMRVLLPLLLCVPVIALLACGGGEPAQPQTGSGAAAPEPTAMAPEPTAMAAEPTAAMASETTLETQGESFEFQLVCINRNVAACELVDSFFVPEVAKRTDGQVQFNLSSFPELGIAGADTLRLVADNTLEVAEVYSGYVGGDLPLLDVGNLWGLSPSEEAHLELTDAIDAELVAALKETTGGQPIMRHYYPNQLIFSREPLDDLAAFENKQIRQHSTILGDLLAGLGAEGQFVAFADVYTALERGVLDAGVTGGEPGHSQRWYEVTDYLYGPIIGSVAVAYFTMSSDSWSQLPPDIQQIILDVGKEHEKLARKTLIEEWNVFSVEANVEAGMIHRPFSDEVQNKMREVALNVILPNWVERTGGPNSDAAQLYNDKVAPILGVAINPDGSAKELVAAMMSEGTTLETQGESFEFQLVCINRNVAACELVDSFFVPEVAKRTDGQVQFNLSSFPELGIAGADTLRLVADNTLEVAEVYSGYVGGDLPLLDVGNLWGLSPSEEAHLELTDAIDAELVAALKETTGGQPIMRHYYPNQLIFSREPLDDLAAFENKQIRQHSTILGDLLAGLGAEGQFVAFADVYTALERGVLDAGVTGGEPGHSQRWYEVTDYLYGPIIGSVAVAYFTMSSDSWSQLPPDIQQIILDVGKEHEKLARKTLIEEWNVFSVEANVEAGMIHRPFSDEVQNKMREVALNVILPNWVERTGGPNSDAAQLYNDKVAPILGVAINPDGTAKELN